MERAILLGGPLHGREMQHAPAVGIRINESGATHYYKFKRGLASHGLTVYVYDKASEDEADRLVAEWASANL